jgi:hypothetical protein
VLNSKGEPGLLRCDVNELLRMRDLHLRARPGTPVISLAKCVSGGMFISWEHCRQEEVPISFDFCNNQSSLGT